MPERVRVVQLVYTLHVESGGGGLTRAAIDLAQNLDPAEFEVSIIGLGDNGSEAEKNWIRQFTDQGIAAETAVVWDNDHPYRSFWRSYQALKEKFSRRPPDIVHSHSEFTDISAIWLKMQGVVPTVVRSSHYGYAIEWRNRPLRRALLTNFLFPIVFDLEIGTNPAMVTRLNRRWVARLLRTQSVYVSGAVKLDRFSQVQVDTAAKKHSLGIPAEALVVGCVGRLVEQKGYGDLLQAAQQVIRCEPSAYFMIVGEGPLEQALKDQARTLGIQDRVIFTGSRSDVEELFAIMDIYAMASLWEGFPNTVMESMASGTPVVTTNIAGSRDIIQHGENGWLVPPGDPAAMSAAILALLAAPQQRQVLAHTAQQSVQQFSSVQIARRYAEHYRNVLSAKRQQ